MMGQMGKFLEVAMLKAKTEERKVSGDERAKKRAELKELLDMRRLANSAEETAMYDELIKATGQELTALIKADAANATAAAAHAAAAASIAQSAATAAAAAAAAASVTPSPAAPVTPVSTPARPQVSVPATPAPSTPSSAPSDSPQASTGAGQ